MSFLNPAPAVSEQETKNQDAARRTLHKAGNAYSNYRQFSRDNYNNQLSNQSSLYQGMMNRLASAYGAQGSPNVSQMSSNPMSLRQTTVGSTFGSNAAGWGQGDPGNVESGHTRPGDNNFGIIGQLGATNPNDELSGNPNRTGGLRAGGGQLALGQQPTLWDNGQQRVAGMPQIYTGGASWAPPQVAQSGGAPGNFSFAPRRP